MGEEHTTVVVQRYLNELATDSPAEPIVRALLDQAVRRLHLLCATLLYRSYPRLLNDLARRLDERPPAVELREGLVPAPASSGSGLTSNGRRMLEAIDNLPEDQREAFCLVRLQGMTQTETAGCLCRHGGVGEEVKWCCRAQVHHSQEHADGIRPMHLASDRSDRRASHDQRRWHRTYAASNRASRDAYCHVRRWPST
jgi:hypothetical protein